VSLSDDGDIVAIGTGDTTTEVGLARVYQYQTGDWSQLGPDILGEPNTNAAAAVWRVVANNVRLLIVQPIQT
jgi:hypothetical protein